MYTEGNINYNLYTRLSCKTLMKADKSNPVIEVLTPHKGVVFIEIKEVEKGLFRKAMEVDRKTNQIIKELRELERDAKDYLLSQFRKAMEVDRKTNQIIKELRELERDAKDYLLSQWNMGKIELK